MNAQVIRLAVLLLVTARLAPVVRGANILCIMTVPSPSHHIWNRVVMEELVARGHNVTVVSQDGDKSRTNLTYILLEKVYSTIYQDEQLDLLEVAKETAFQSLFTFKEFYMGMCRGALLSDGLKVILSYPDSFRFDVVLYDFGCGPCLLPLLHKFHYPPLVSLTPFSNPPFSVFIAGGHKHYAYTPHFALPYGSKMGFLQRVSNTLLYLAEASMREFYIMPALDTMVRTHFGYEDMPYLGELEQRTVVMLLNTNPTFDSLEPLPPNVIGVGGAHIKDPAPLPDDLERFVQGGKKGAVLFSLGSNVRSDTIGEHRQRVFIEAFRQMPDYHFMWKFESELNIPLPPNVIIRPWLPQNSILNHPKVKAFITHSGGLSTQEASWFGVPLIGMPLFIDQHRNLARSVTAGVAEKLDFASITTDDVRRTVLKVLETPSYRDNMKHRAMYFRDQPESPLQRAIWWIEFAVRHPTVQHLRSPTLELGTIRSNLLDVYAFLCAIVLIVLWWIHYTIKKLLFQQRRVLTKRKRE